MRARSSTSAVAVLAAVATALLLVLPAQASGAAGTGVRETGSSATGASAVVVTTILARDTTPDSTAVLYDTQTVRLFSVTFTTTTPNVSHRVRGKIIATVPLSTAEPTMLSSGTIFCWGPDEQRPTKADDRDHALNHQMNVLRGETGTISPRWSYVARTPGIHRCELSWHTTHHGYSGEPGSVQAIRAQPGSYLEVTSPLPPAADQVRPVSDDGLIVRPSAPSVNILSRRWTAPDDVTSLAVNGDVMLTACTSSTDRFCEPRDYDKVNGSTATTTLVVAQFASDGGYCAVTRSVASRRVSRARHHLTTYSGLWVPVSTAPGCTRSFRVYLNVRWARYGGMKVHLYSAVSSVVPLP